MTDNRQSTNRNRGSVDDLDTQKSSPTQNSNSDGWYAPKEGSNQSGRRAENKKPSEDDDPDEFDPEGSEECMEDEEQYRTSQDNNPSRTNADRLHRNP